MIDNWELRVWSPVGAGPRVISRDESFIRSSGLRMQLTPEGDCREAAFEARGDRLGIAPLDCVQVVYGGIPLFYGEVRVGGNVRDTDGHGYTLRSLALSLKEVTLSDGFATPQQPAHLTVQAILRDVQGSGALGSPSVIDFDAALCPDLGFDCRAVVDAHQQTAASLLERIAEDGAAYGVTVRYGVRPDRKFFCRAADTDSCEIQRGDIASLTWQEPVAETPVTAVLWYIAQGDNGSWVTHLSEAPEAGVYRRRVKALTLGAGVDTGALGLTEQWVTVDWASFEVLNFRFATDEASSKQDKTLASMTDDEKRSILNALSQGSAKLFFGYMLLMIQKGEEASFKVVASRAFTQLSLSLSGTIGMNTAVKDGYPAEDVLQQGSDGTTAALKVKVLVDGIYRQTLRLTETESRHVLNYPGREVALVVDWSGYSDEALKRSTLALRLTRLRGEYANPASLGLLDRLARYHYSTPTPTPADIELRTFISPAELPKYVTLGGWQSLVDGWEYRLTAERGMTLACLAGQAEDPASLAQAELIKARDGQAVIAAISVGGRA